MVNESRNKKMKVKNQPQRSAWATLGLLFALALAFFDYEVSSAVENPPPLTQILRVDVIPNPVAAGDSLTLRCVTIDSLATGYTFAWRLPGGVRIDTTVPVLRIKAPNEPGAYGYTVTVRNNLPNVLFPGRNFFVEVIP
jgi:hypothetical protein